LSLLKHCLNYKQWCEAKDSGLSTSLLSNKELQTLFSVLDNFHATHEQDITVADLSNLLFATVSKDHEFYSTVLANLASLEVSTETTKTLLHAVVRKAKLQQLSLAAYAEYEGTGKAGEFDKLLEAFKALPEEVTEDEDFEFVSDSLSSLVEAAVSTPGLRWRLQTLNRMLGSLRKGNFGFVFARPETGKTTFLASEVSFMCSQLGETDGPIVWLANEEPGANVKLRVYQAWFGITLEQLLSNVPHWEQLFIKESKSKIKILDKAIIHKSTVEKLCKKLNPSLLIFDQIDKITGFDNDREDLRLGSIYQWARELAKNYCPTIGICQADGNGEGITWLTMGHVANAKTAKQAEADWILGIGKQNADGYENIRYLHLSKNKLLGDSDTNPSLRHGKQEVLLEAHLARYRDLF
jgi:KaiC/GvpD/RAD55 family RecA-like ATPase